MKKSWKFLSKFTILLPLQTLQTCLFFSVHPPLCEQPPLYFLVTLNQSTALMQCEKVLCSELLNNLEIFQVSRFTHLGMQSVKRFGMSFQDFRHFCYLDTLSHVVQVTRQVAEDIVSSLEPGKFSNVSRETFLCLSAPRLLGPRRHLNIILGILCSVEGGKKLISNYVQIFFYLFITIPNIWSFLSSGPGSQDFCSVLVVVVFWGFYDTNLVAYYHIIIVSLVQILSVFNRFI